MATTTSTAYLKITRFELARVGSDTTGDGDNVTDNHKCSLPQNRFELVCKSGLTPPHFEVYDLGCAAVAREHGATAVCLGLGGHLGLGYLGLGGTLLRSAVRVDVVELACNPELSPLRTVRYVRPLRSRRHCGRTRSRYTIAEKYSFLGLHLRSIRAVNTCGQTDPRRRVVTLSVHAHSP